MPQSTFHCNLAAPPTPLAHAWEHCVGSGRALLGLRADWREQLQRVHAELGVQRVRFHGLLDDDMGTLICQNEHELLSFFNIDSIFDFLLSIGMQPYCELSFMPATLASGSETVFRYRGNITPPKDHARWAALIDKLVRHWVQRYGVQEVATWCLEVWNEPNLKAFWSGGREGYHRLYASTVQAIKAVDASLRVGGPATAQNAWIAEFLAHCAAHGLPVDFISTHYYPTDAFGQIGADTLTQLEHAPRDVMHQRALQARAQAGRLPLYYSEWNISSNPRDALHDEAFAAAFAADIALSVDPLVQGCSFWTFTDIFEENYFPSVPFHGGFGLLNLHGVAKPVYRAFELLHALGDSLYPVERPASAPETLAVHVSGGEGFITVFVTHYAMPRHTIGTVLLSLRLTGCAAPVSALLSRIDDDHANARRAWAAMGEPTYPSPQQLQTLHAASALRPVVHPLRTAPGVIEFELVMPPQSLAALRIELAAA